MRFLSAKPPELVEVLFVDKQLLEHLSDRLFKMETIHGKTAFLYALIKQNMLALRAKADRGWDSDTRTNSPKFLFFRYLKSIPDSQINWQHHLQYHFILEETTRSLMVVKSFNLALFICSAA
uniref:Transposase, YhgA-like n=1 Tax=Candidatus Kentrum sp. TUN TaxID=2126343 RepID=A0A450ZLY5_9GAMM|nr:MAG: Putative transposase, YhgA-like [Candidatus Kentron sp. TUN]VFK59951.1 MAG: Putative transposase, YhgA-like [Candidatus Kentron sp. TUN]